jgi:carbonic anhydrase/acetyltransferase-like protein (isoleucine patch superfamily)
MPVYEFENIRPELPERGKFWIAPDATLVGKVRLHENVSIWFNAVLRGDNEWIDIGSSTNIQDGCVMHTDPGYPLKIGEGCTIGHRAIVHGCTIGNNSLVGMGATLMNGAKIGNNSIVGANALVAEGKEFPDNSLIVGAPAKLVRALDDKTINFLKLAAASYYNRWPKYAASFKRID